MLQNVSALDSHIHADQFSVMTNCASRRSFFNNVLYRLSLPCLALEEKRIDEVSMESVRCEDFVAIYRKRVKEEQLEYEIKVSRTVHCSAV